MRVIVGHLGINPTSLPCLVHNAKPDEECVPDCYYRQSLARRVLRVLKESGAEPPRFPEEVEFTISVGAKIEIVS